jgi:hypothetical protein
MIVVVSLVENLIPQRRPSGVGLSFTTIEGPTDENSILRPFAFCDYLDRLLGLGASLVGTVLFAIAPSVWWVFGGRVFMGVGVGLSAGPSTVQQPSRRQARGVTHDDGASGRVCICPARGRCADGICTLADTAWLFGACRPFGGLGDRHMVSSAPYVRR